MISVTCAVIRNEEDEVLVVQRGEATDHPFKWEFPGGKLFPGETNEDCIIREVEEELSMNIVICGKLPEVEYDYGNKKINLIPFICDTLDELPFLSEHLAYRWMPSADLTQVDFSEADVFVAESYLQRIKNRNITEVSTVPESAQALSDDLDLQTMVNNMMSMKEADPYLSQMVEALKKIDNESTLRSFLRIISLSEIEKIDINKHGILADFCFNVLKSGYSAIAVKAYSMEILYRLSLIYPELANELSVTLRILMEDGTAAITSRGRIILKKLAGVPLNPKSSQKLS